MAGKYRPGQDLEMMQDPDEWPRFPHLPLKRRQTGDSARYQSGFLEALTYLLGEAPKPVVWLGSLDSIQHDRQKIEYSNFGELVEDGWLVD